MTLTREHEKIKSFLLKNGWVESIANDDCISFYHQDTSSIDVNEKDIIFIDDSGDWASIPLSYYALVGFIYVHRLIPMRCV